MEDPFDFKGMRQSRESAVAVARKAAPGLPREHIVPGALVTISPCKCTGDRSYSHDIWEVLSANEGHLSIRKHAAKNSDWFVGPHIVCLHEHEFYGADHLVPAPIISKDSQTVQERT